MKKFLFICFITLLAACSKDDESSGNNKSGIHPPEWLIGTWDAENGMNTFRFTRDDLIVISMSTEISLKEQLKAMAAGGAEVEETIEDDEYEIRLSIQGVSQIYHFIRVNDNNIMWIMNGVELPLERK